MAEYFGYTTKPEHCQRLYTTISDTKYHPAFSVERLQRIAITFHSSKGLEFDQVILFVSDYRLSNEQEIYNHYVAATRAKTKLIMVYIHGDWVAEQFVRNINRIMAESSLEITDIAIIVSR